MGVLSSITGFITGNSKTAQKAIDAVYNGTDKIVFTEEEKADAYQKRYDAWLELQKALANESSPRSVNRRIFSWGIFSMVSFLTLLGIGFGISGNKEAVEVILKFADAFKWGYAFSAAIIFYYGPHLAKHLTGK